jgi:biopolymer transport protein ExbB/TolQ
MSHSSSSPQSIPPAGDGGRLLALFLAGCLGVLFVILLNLIGPLQITSTEPNGTEVVRVDFSKIAVDWTYFTDQSGTLTNRRNPYAVQTFMWIAMFVGMGELWLRWRSVRSEKRMLGAGLLPEDERTLLTTDDLRPIYVKARALPREYTLPALVRRLSMEFRKSKSIDRVNALLDTSLELFQHRLDLRYTLIRYLVWVIPTLGFLGTVIGIANAMAFAGSGAVEIDQLLTPTTQRLAVAFYTTLLALIQSAILVMGMSWIQSDEETIINESGQYCLENLVMRLMEPGQVEAARSKSS